MAQLEATTTTHLDHEEEISEPLYAEHQDHPAIKEMGKKFSRRIVDRQGRHLLRLARRTAPPPRRRPALRANVPGPVLAIIGGLFGRGYRKEIAPVWATSGSF